jgi:hypothetical protein
MIALFRLSKVRVTWRERWACLEGEDVIAEGEVALIAISRPNRIHAAMPPRFIGER